MTVNLRRMLTSFVPFILFGAIVFVFYSMKDKASSNIPSPFIGKTVPVFKTSPLGSYPSFNRDVFLMVK